jgi:hypothetical protein
VFGHSFENYYLSVVTFGLRSYMIGAIVDCTRPRDNIPLRMQQSRFHRQSVFIAPKQDDDESPYHITTNWTIRSDADAVESSQVSASGSYVSR